MIKKTLTAMALALFFNSCDAGDNKNEVENYPTYDTTEATNTINDSVTGNMREGGDLRHNTESPRE